MTAICASHYRNPLNDFVGRKHHHKNRFRQRQSSRSAFYQPGLRIAEEEPPEQRCTKDSHRSIHSCQQQQQQEPQQPLCEPNGKWQFRPSALQYEDYGTGDMSVTEIVDMYVRDNERADREGVKIPPRPMHSHHSKEKRNSKNSRLMDVRDALFHASSAASTASALRCLQWNIQAFTSPKDERNMDTITAGIIRAICEKDADVLVINEIHWREMERFYNDQCRTSNNSIDCYERKQKQIGNSQALLEEVLRLRGYHFSRVAKHGDTPTMIATRKKVVAFEEVVLSENRSALCLLIEDDSSVLSCSGKCWVVGTHLDAFDAEQRRTEISRLLASRQQQQQQQQNNESSSTTTTTSSSIPVLIMGDFNQQRSKDYTPQEWNHVANSARRRNVPVDDGVSGILESNGFRCILDDAATASNNASSSSIECNWESHHPPPSTHWSGTTIDYTYYCNNTTTTTSNANTSTTTTTIAPHGVYVGSEGFSDHRMTVSDWNLTTKKIAKSQPIQSTQDTQRNHIDKSFFFHHLPEGRHHSWLFNLTADNKRNGTRLLPSSTTTNFSASEFVSKNNNNNNNNNEEQHTQTSLFRA